MRRKQWEAKWTKQGRFDGGGAICQWKTISIGCLIRIDGGFRFALRLSVDFLVSRKIFSGHN